MIKNEEKKCIEQMSLSNESRNSRGFLFLLTNFGLLILVKTRQPEKKNTNKQTNKKQKTMIHHLINPEALKRMKNLWRFRRCVRNKKLHHER